MRSRSLLLLTIVLGSTAPHLALAQFSTSFETPTYSTGNVAGQSGWTGNFVGGVPTANAQVVGGNAASGSQSLRLIETPGLNTSVGAYIGSPIFPLVRGRTVSSIDIKIAGAKPSASTGGATYWLSYQSLVDGYVTADIHFTARGDITVLHRDAVGTYLHVDTGADWTPDTYFNFKVLTDENANSLLYQLNGTTIYTESNGLFLAKSINQMIIGADRRQIAGEAAYFDNISVTQAVPEPATIAGLLAGTAFLLRRRKR